MKLEASERDIHLGVVKLLRRAASPSTVWAHIANERKCSAREGALLKALGVRAGVPDFIILAPYSVDGPLGRRHYGPRTYFLEIKTPKGRLSSEQRQFQADVEKIGIVYAVARSTDEAARFLSAWGALRSSRERRAAA